MTRTEALKLALEALKQSQQIIDEYMTECVTARQANNEAITVIKEALAQPEQKPAYSSCFRCVTPKKCSVYGCCQNTWPSENATPPQRKPLTDGLPCCGYTDATAIKWNEFNHAVQCHNCGHTYTQTSNKPLTLDYIDQHIGADEGDREAVVALVREVEAAHGITKE